MTNRYQFFMDTYKTERIKTLAIWNEFEDKDLLVRPNSHDPRGRNLLEQMIHQCISEDLWFKNMFGIDVQSSPLPETETRYEFILRYHEDSRKRLDMLKEKKQDWWEENTIFFGEPRTRAWVMMRRIAHSAHHRGQLTYLLRMLGKPLYSTYGPTADTGGLMVNKAPTIYAYENEEAIIKSINKTRLPTKPEKSVTERPDST